MFSRDSAFESPELRRRCIHVRQTSLETQRKGLGAGTAVLVTTKLKPVLFKPARPNGGWCGELQRWQNETLARRRGHHGAMGREMRLLKTAVTANRISCSVIRWASGLCGVRYRIRPSLDHLWRHHGDVKCTKFF